MNPDRTIAEEAIREAFAELSELRNDLTLNTTWSNRWHITTDAGLWVAIYVSNVFTDRIKRVPVTVGVWDAVWQNNHTITDFNTPLGELVETITNVFRPRIY